MIRHLLVSGFVTALAAGTSPALAEPTTLLCDLKDHNNVFQNEPTAVQLSSSTGTVIVNFSAVHAVGALVCDCGEDGQGGLNALSTGPLPAQFGADKITFSFVHNKTVLMVLNRLTGDFFEENGTIFRDFTCHVAKQQF